MFNLKFLSRLVLLILKTSSITNPTVNKYEIKHQVNSSESTQTQTQTRNKIAEIIKKMLDSIEKSVTINEEEENDFYRLLYELGENTTNNENENRKRMDNIEEAISLLTTEFHQTAIVYLSERMKDFLSKSYINQISIEIIEEIIDSYFYIREEKQKQEKEGEEKRRNGNLRTF